VKLGLENKRQTAFLGVLVVVCGYLVYANFLSGPSVPSAKPRTETAAADPAPVPTIPQVASPAAAPRVQAARGRSDEFHPVYLQKRPEDRIDLTKVDPTLHLELLAKLQAAAPEEGGRNLFQFGAPPPPPEAKTAAKLGPEPVVIPQPKPVAPAAPAPVSAPPPPPIPLKYYGSSKARANGRKAAFFLDGDNILIATEGELLQKRYRVVRIGDNSVVLEDTQLKREQSLPLAEDANAPG
jgi:hypothetical protein